MAEDACQAKINQEDLQGAASRSDSLDNTKDPSNKIPKVSFESLNNPSKSPELK